MVQKEFDYSLDLDKLFGDGNVISDTIENTVISRQTGKNEVLVKLAALY